MSKSNLNMLAIGIVVEGCLIGLALLISQLNFYDHRQPWSAMAGGDWVGSSLAGVVATLPLLGYLLLFHFWHPRFYQPMREFIQSHLKPMFANSSLAELALLAVMAGLGEELFFRWCLQGGLYSVAEPNLPAPFPTLFSLFLASVLFGVCHWVNVSYFVFAAMAGLYFGGVMLLTESWWAAAVAHALFDFIALLHLRFGRDGGSNGTGNPTPSAMVPGGAGTDVG